MSYGDSGMSSRLLVLEWPDKWSGPQMRKSPYIAQLGFDHLGADGDDDDDELKLISSVFAAPRCSSVTEMV